MADRSNATRELVRVPDAAARFAVSPDTLYRAFTRGDVDGVRIGRSVRLYRDSLDDWLRRGQTVDK